MSIERATGKFVDQLSAKQTTIYYILLSIYIRTAAAFVELSVGGHVVDNVEELHIMYFTYLVR